VAVTRKIKLHASEDRLEQLIEERLRPGADKAQVDKRIWDLFGEEWTILYTDMSGFSRNVAEFGIIHFLQVVHESKKILIPCIDRFDGILLKMEGDSMLVIFRNTLKAVDCAIAMQHAVEAYNGNRTPQEKVLLCIGIGHGSMLRIGDEDVFGAEVNAACKLGEDTAKSGEILLTGAVAKLLRQEQLHQLDMAPAGAAGAYRLQY
jgi:adenylate cyclase